MISSWPDLGSPTTYYLMSMLVGVYYVRDSARDKEQELVVKEGKELMTMKILMEILGWDHDELVSVLYL